MQADGLSKDTWGQDLAFQHAIHNRNKNDHDESRLPTHSEGDENSDYARNVCADNRDKFADKDDDSEQDHVGNAYDHCADTDNGSHDHGKDHLPSYISTQRFFDHIEQRANLFSLFEWCFMPQPIN